MPAEKRKLSNAALLLRLLALIATNVVFIVVLLYEPLGDPLFQIGAAIEIGLAFLTYRMPSVQIRWLLVVGVLAILIPGILSYVPVLSAIQKIGLIYLIAASAILSYNLLRYRDWFRSDTEEEMMIKFPGIVFPKYIPPNLWEDSKGVVGRGGRRVAKIQYEHERNNGESEKGCIWIEQAYQPFPNSKPKKNWLIEDEDINGVAVNIRKKIQKSSSENIESKWSHNDIYFKIWSLKVSYLEIKKVIEFMIT